MVKPVGMYHCFEQKKTPEKKTKKVKKKKHLKTIHQNYST